MLPPAYAREPGAESDKVRADPDVSQALRFSLAGVQLKFSATTKTSGSLAIPAKGVGGHRIVKLPSERHAGVPRNEYSMMTLASKLSMNVPRVKVADIRDIENLPSGPGQMREREAVATTAYVPDETSALKFSRSKFYKDLTLDELAHMADRANLPEKLVLNAAKDTVQRFRELWSQERSNRPLSQDVIQALERQLSLVPLARQ